MKEWLRKNKFLLLIIISILAVVGVTFAFFQPQLQSGDSKDVDINANTTDDLQFNITNDISLNINQFNFGVNAGNLSSNATGTATLLANNSTNTATYTYYVYFRINYNEFVYTSSDSKPEIILSITNPSGQEVTSIEGLNYVTASGADGTQVKGFDITTASGLFPIAINYSISANGTTPTVQEWDFTATFINLDSDQQANTGKSMDADIIMQREEYDSTFATVIKNLYTDGSNGLYYHDGSMISTQGICTYNDNEVFALTESGGEQASNETDCERIFSLTFDGTPEYYDASIITVGVPEGVVKEVNWNSSSGICETKTSKIPVYSEMNGETDVPASQSECVGYGAVMRDGALLFEEMGSGTFGQAIIDANDNSYRYAGANPNNYVCFGSDDASCPSDNLYRIIGVFDNEVKLIKSTSYGSYAWDSNNSNTWSSSTMRSTLNTTYYNSLSATWQNKIATHTWKVGGMEWSLTNTAKQYYDTEVGSSSSSTTDSMKKIGLMYVSDYGFAASTDYWTTGLNGYNDSTLRSTNWLYLGSTEWTLTPISSSSTDVFILYSNGFLDGNNANNGYSVRPVFYLNSDVLLVGGNGTESHPYRIS